MIRSMTGYGSARTEAEGFALSVNVRSLNHRFLDLQVRLPSGLEALEPELRRSVKDRVARGHVEVSVSLERAGAAALELDRKVLGAYLAALRELRKELGTTAEPDSVALLRVPGIVAATNGQVTATELEGIRRALEALAAEALGALNQMREREGEALERELRDRLERLQSLCKKVENMSGGASRLYQKRLEARVRELIRDAPAGVAPDAARLAQEAAFLASRSDITEEVARLSSHLAQASRLLGEKAEAGKKLDFLLQEMNREANTILSKTADVPEVGLEISRAAIEMKTEIEKLREQAQNVE